MSGENYGYVYFCRERPPAPGAVPADRLLEVYTYPHPIHDQMIDHDLYGYVRYSRRLTDEEIDQYELYPQEEY